MVVDEGMLVWIMRVLACGCGCGYTRVSELCMYWLVVVGVVLWVFCLHVGIRIWKCSAVVGWSLGTSGVECLDEVLFICGTEGH